MHSRRLNCAKGMVGEGSSTGAGICGLTTPVWFISALCMLDTNSVILPCCQYEIEREGSVMRKDGCIKSKSSHCGQTKHPTSRRGRKTATGR